MKKIIFFLFFLVLSTLTFSLESSSQDKISIDRKRTEGLLNDKIKTDEKILKSLKLKAINSRSKELIEVIELIEQKKFKHATKILTEALLKDRKNEQLIMSLLNYIENEKEKIINQIYSVVGNMEEGDFQKVSEIIRSIDEASDFDVAIEKMKQILFKEKDSLEKINSFNNLIAKAENFLLKYDGNKAIEYYQKALDVFRISNIELINDKSFKNFINSFNIVENNLIKKGINILITEKKDCSVKELLDTSSFLKYNLSQILQIKEEFKSLKRVLENVNFEVKKTLEYEAYFSVLNKYIYTIDTICQRNYQIFLENIIQIILQNAVEIRNGNESKINEVKDLFLLINENENSAFKDLFINLKSSTFINRSQKNIEIYLSYLTKKRIIMLEYLEAIIGFYLTKSNNSYENYLLLSKEKKLIEALKELENSYNKIKEAELHVNNFYDTYSKISEIKIPLLVVYKNRVESYKEQINEKASKLSLLLEEVQNRRKYVEILAENADRVYNQAVVDYKAKRYQAAKDNFLIAKNSYLDVYSENYSSRIEEKLNSIDRYLEEIERLLFREQLKEAEAHLEKAINYIYTERFEDAKKEIDEALFIYEKFKENEAIYKENLSIINYYRERVLTAMKIKSSKELSIYDKAYEEITELMNTARRYYDRGEYEKARNVVAQVLLEKPYYEEAKLLEVKILLKLDPANFERIYNNYFNEAKDKFDRKLYDQAILAFEQLLKFEKNTKLINNYIIECKKQLGLIKTELREEDKNYARRLVEEATQAYAGGDYLVAYNKANTALTIWSDVPKARDIREAARQRLGYERPKLTRENEVKYRLAEKAYAAGNYEEAYNLTNEILRTQDFDFVKQLNRQADLRRQR